MSVQSARAELQTVIQELEGLQGRLLEIRRGLPPPQSSTEDDLSAEPGVTTEMGRVIECVLEDRIQPAIRDLLAAAQYRARRKKEP